MELRHLQTSRAVAETLSFRRAAERLSYAQSSVTEQIQALERDLDATLFERSGRTLRLTPAGTRLLASARELIALADRTRRAVAEEHAGRRELRIGALETLCWTRLPRALVATRRDSPHLRLLLRSGKRAALLDAVRHGELDACFTFASAQSDGADDPLAGDVVGGERLVVIVPHRHRLARRTAIATAELTDEPMLITTDGCAYRAATERAFRDAGISMRVVAEMGSLAAIRAAVAAGGGIALVPSPVADASVVTRSWNDPASRLHVVVSRHERHVPPPELDTLIVAVRSAFEPHDSGA